MSHFLLGYSYRQGERITPSTQSVFESFNLGIERKQKGLDHGKMKINLGYLVNFSKNFF
jgi:hypothetical protein